MQEETRGAPNPRSFDELVLPHLDAAYNLARWLVRNTHDAEDVVQEACLRAVKFFEGYHGGDARSWLLRIVRNTSYSFLEKRRPADVAGMGIPARRLVLRWRSPMQRRCSYVPRKLRPFK